MSRNKNKLKPVIPWSGRKPQIIKTPAWCQQFNSFALNGLKLDAIYENEIADYEKWNRDQLKYQVIDWRAKDPILSTWDKMAIEEKIRQQLTPKPDPLERLVNLAIAKWNYIRKI